MKLIPLSQGKHAIVDDEDYAQLSTVKWSAMNTDGLSYAIRHVAQASGKKRGVLMHRVIMKAPDGIEIDHINGNGLDNRKANLRFCNHSQNVRNRHQVSGRSQFKGVSWYGRDRKWYAHIRFSGKRYHLGVFEDEVDAALVYDRAAVKYHGEFARLNFPGRKVA